MAQNDFFKILVVWKRVRYFESIDEHRKVKYCVDQLHNGLPDDLTASLFTLFENIVIFLSWCVNKILIEICIQVIWCKFNSPVHLLKQGSLLSWILYLSWYIDLLRFSLGWVFLAIFVIFSMLACLLNAIFTTATAFTAWTATWVTRTYIRWRATTTVIIAFAWSLWLVCLWCIVWLVLYFALVCTSGFDIWIWSSLEVLLVCYCFSCLFRIFCQRLLLPHTRCPCIIKVCDEHIGPVPLSQDLIYSLLLLFSLLKALTILELDKSNEDVHQEVKYHKHKDHIEYQSNIRRKLFHR